MFKKLLSSFIQGAEYSESKKALRIIFGSDSVAVFLDVPLDVYEGLINAESHGKYYHRHIKGKYTAEKGNNAWNAVLHST